MLSDSPDFYFRMNDTGDTMTNAVNPAASGSHAGALHNIESPLVNVPSDRSTGYTAGPDQSEFFVTNIFDYSIEFFMKTNQAVGAGVNHWSDGAGLVDASLSDVINDTGTALVGGGKVGFGEGSPDVTIKSTTTVNDNQWHHVVATFNAPPPPGR